MFFSPIQILIFWTLHNIADGHIWAWATCADITHIPCTFHKWHYKLFPWGIKIGNRVLASGDTAVNQLFINCLLIIVIFYRKQYPLPAVSRLASRGEQWLHVCYIYMLWFSFILGLNFISLCFKLIIIHYHAQKQREIKFKPRIKFNHNIITNGSKERLEKKSKIMWNK